MSKTRTVMISQNRTSLNNLNTIVSDGQLNYSDHITELHRQYLTSIAPLNILFGTMTAAPISSGTIDSEQNASDLSTTPLYSDLDRDHDIDNVGVRQEESYAIIEGPLVNDISEKMTNSTSDGTVLESLNDNQRQSLLSNRDFWPNAETENFEGPRRFKSEVMFSIENIMKKD